MSPYNVYEKNMTQIESKEDLLLATFDELLSKLNMVKIAITEGLIEAKIKELDKAILGLEVLRSSLDFEKGGEIAKNLDAIYAFCIDEIIKANATNKVEYINNALEVLKPIAEGFKESLKNPIASAS
ncbi:MULTISPECIES: flagellar export chaperone FliS [unclassified Nitratiruptor]|uniref:flagellar export chaperone FliS n=1 Tax=unclassified Nitratiruptor TaxID=2624044 RepID=UPI001915EF9C|nr:MULTISPECIES: flagellar export chaperone FliS [unclassified Nitratiruptor]BCD59942.1 flagellar protein FliS [Nitratiruptor sp. YY08-10]BCD63865.1 flagellar protein FliS [Nitratiruptor sp. YY08-14]